MHLKPTVQFEQLKPLGCRVSIIIKALNEEARIEETIASALRAVALVGGEVILADSCSTDRTVALAQCYPISIVQLKNAHERCCGVGPQLGYQHSRGEFIYILDGDMQMLDGFLNQALAFMSLHPEVAGVGGRVVEKNTHSLEFVARSERMSAHMSPGRVDRLDGGALYRRSAIEVAGYFSNRNLHSYEEYDLAIRLHALNWQLWRLPVDAVCHYGHDEPPYQLLMRRWRSGYICGLGELVRASFGQKRLHLVAYGLRELQLYAAVLIWWCVLISVLFWPVSLSLKMGGFCALLIAPLALMTLRKRSLTKAFYSVVSWCFNAAGTVRGLLAHQRPVHEIISSRIIQETSDVLPVCASGISH